MASRPPILVRTFAFTVLFPGTVCMLGPALVLRYAGRYRPMTVGVVSLLGVVMIAVGILMYAWCAWDFGRHGRGTPAPYDPPRSLVTQGLYRYTRNPMYVGIIVLLLGESLLWRSSPLGIYAACVWLAFHARVVLYEEPTLKRNFPGSFEHYFRTVPRWGLRSHKT